MIRDPKAKADIAEQWAAVRKLCKASHRGYAVPGLYINETPLAEHCNLPFVLAYAVLDQVLSILIEQGAFSCKGWKLGAKMEASRGPLYWRDYDRVKTGKRARNKLAYGLLSEKRTALIT
jgi:hypothetical protein